MIIYIWSFNFWFWHTNNTDFTDLRGFFLEHFEHILEMLKESKKMICKTNK